MDNEFVNDILNKLADGQLNEFRVTNEHFLTFRNILVIRPDFKHFQGIAQHGGDVIYRYMKEARS
ncbi:hypothetical protein [Fredinandcohnia quinoae]|uniref:Uncharacterized protein n=1 Tax=Fredinandcohnia quinoae TaxID=2918902 RepID=A0AAW5EBY2_9BACI|nr:hypothetical protein [Fredinandcohnia sp. SECRCQ15]MCH1626966.1 hypothetical protein [Fredinandcohnia sp. SECRCQ15]